MIKAIVAYNANRVIGDDTGNIPWRIPEDLKFFKEATMGCPVIMGRKTWEALPPRYKPLPGRTNIVVSRSFYPIPNVSVSPSIEGALDHAMYTCPDKTIWIVGGAEVYKYCLDKWYVEAVFASEVKGYLDVKGKAFFPELDPEIWKRDVIKEYDDFSVVHYLRWTTDDEINWLYGEIATAVAKKVANPDDLEIAKRVEDLNIKLRELQHKSADEIEKRFHASLKCPLGAGMEAIAKADALIAKYSKGFEDEVEDKRS